MAKSKLVKVNEKIAEHVVSGYKKIEEGVVGEYKKIEDAFVDQFLTKVGMRQWVVSAPTKRMTPCMEGRCSI